MKAKKLLSLILALTMVLALLPTAAFAADAPTVTETKLPFTDVPENYWARSDIQFTQENAIFKGRTDTLFDPEAPLTVAEAIMLAGRLCWQINGGEGDLPEVPDLTGVYARFYDEDGKELAALDSEHSPVGITMGGSYFALSSQSDDPAYPEICTVEVGIEGLTETMTSQCTRETYSPPPGVMTQGYTGTGYRVEDEAVRAELLRLHYLVNPDYTAGLSVNEWWYPADFWLRYYNQYWAITDMCFHIAQLHPDENGAYSTDYDPVNWFPREHTTRTMFACLIDGAVSEELEVLNDVSSIPDVDPEKSDAEAVLRLYRAGILTGMDAAGNFNGDGELTRAQAATILARVLDPVRRIKLS